MAAASEVSDGPVLSVINKRLRALRKKHNRILQMEDNLINGKALNKEQEETFRSKPVVLACIDELEKLRHPLSAAVTEEIDLATTSTQQHNQVSVSDSSEEDLENKLKDLIGLIYFGNMFDHAKWHHHHNHYQSGEFVSTMLQRTMHERACCLNYDCMPDTDDDDDDDDSSDVVIDLLSENDLDSISMLSDLLISRPVNSTLSHKHALQRCIEHANLWLTKSDQPIGPESDATYAGLRLKLNKIISSLYFTRDPVFKVEEVVANYGSYLVPGEESVGVIMPVDASDAPAVQFQQKEEQSVSSQANDSKEIQGSTVEEVQQEGNFSEQPAGQEEVTYDTGGVDNLQEADYKDQQAVPFDQETVPLRSYQNYRGNHSGGGGIRRGYSNGRGGRGRGGSYQNGRNQYNDQSGNYYQKNYYNNRGRGGRSTDGGGNYNQHASGGQAGTFYADD